MKFFNSSRALREFGEIIAICAVVKLKRATGVEIRQWMCEKYNIAEASLPSSYMYPLLNRLASGFVPILLKEGKMYSINPDIESKLPDITRDAIEIKNFCNTTLEILK